MRDVPSLQPIPSQTGVNPWQLKNLQTVPAGLGLKKLFNSLHNELEEL